MGIFDSFHKAYKADLEWQATRCWAEGSHDGKPVYCILDEGHEGDEHQCIVKVPLTVRWEEE